MHVVSREQFVGGFGTQYQRLGIRGITFAGCTFATAVLQGSVSAGHGLGNCAQGISYVKVLPCGQFLHTFADIFESTPGFLQQIIDSFPNAVCLPLCAKKVNLLAESCDGGGKTEQLKQK